MHVWSLAVVVFVAKLQAYDFHSESTRPNISLIAVASILSHAELSFAKHTRHFSSYNTKKIEIQYSHKSYGFWYLLDYVVKWITIVNLINLQLLHIPMDNVWKVYHRKISLMLLC